MRWLLGALIFQITFKVFFTLALEGAHPDWGVDSVNVLSSVGAACVWFGVHLMSPKEK